MCPEVHVYCFVQPAISVVQDCEILFWSVVWLPPLIVRKHTELKCALWAESRLFNVKTYCVWLPEYFKRLIQVFLSGTHEPPYLAQNKLVTELWCDIAETARKESIAGGRSCTYGNTLFVASFVDKPLDEVAGDENSGTDRREISSMFEGGGKVRIEWLAWDWLVNFASWLLCSFLCRLIFTFFPVWISYFFLISWCFLVSCFPLSFLAWFFVSVHVFLLCIMIGDLLSYCI